MEIDLRDGEPVRIRMVIDAGDSVVVVEAAMSAGMDVEVEEELTDG